MSFNCNRVNSEGVKCKQKFSRIDSLKLHIQRFHSKVGCPRCPDLPLFDDDKAALQNHQKSHSVKHRCLKPWCSRNFTLPSLLADHAKLCNVSNEPINCGICVLQFNCTESYRKHLKTVHEKLPEEASSIIEKERSLRVDAVSFPTPNKRSKVAEPTADTTCEVQPVALFKIDDPGSARDRKILKYGELTLLYGFDVRGPRVAHMQLTKANLHPKIPKTTQSPIRVDDKVPLKYRPVHADFLAWDRSNGTPVEMGHLLAAFFMRIDKETAEAITLITTVLPQFKETNQGIWKLMEQRLTWLLRFKYDIIDVFHGGVYEKDVGTVGRLPLASHFFSISICHLADGKFDLEVFCIPHENHDPALGLNPFYMSYMDLIQMDSANFIPRLDLRNMHRENGIDVVTKPLSNPTLS